LTVRTHRQRVMQKLNLHTKSELLKYALRRGLISLDE
jgi:DNA-binding CsgD family transcriptional regulator